MLVPGFMNSMYAVLYCAVLYYAILCCAVLCCVVLCYAMLCYATLCYATLCYAMLCYATLRYAMLCYAMLYCAVLCCTVLHVLCCRGVARIFRSSRQTGTYQWVLYLRLNRKGRPGPQGPLWLRPCAALCVGMCGTALYCTVLCFVLFCFTL